MSFRYGRTAAICLVFVVARAARASRGEDDDDPDAKWVRMCTMTSMGDRGSSEFNATMPCGVHVRPDAEPGAGVLETAGAVGSENSDREHVSETAPVGDFSGKRNGNVLTAVATDETRRQSSEDEETTMLRLDTVQTVDGVDRADGVPDGGDDADDDDDDVTAAAGDGDQNDADDVLATDEDAGDVQVTDGEDGDGQDVDDVLVTDEDDGGPYDVTPVADGHRQEYVYDDGGVGGHVTVVMDGDGDPEYPPKRGRVAKVMLAYLMDARNKLYNKIHYILNLLQNAFFNARLKRNSRRNTIGRQTALNANKQKGDDNNNIEKQSVGLAAITDPTLQSSLMTMSVLMFGVFIIQVVQKLMKTVQRVDEFTYMDRFVSTNLPTDSSNIFKNNY